MAAAKSWRSDALVALRKGELRPPERCLLQEAADHWLEEARAGRIRNRSGDPYKPGAIRAYEAALRLRVLPAFGRLSVSDLRRRDVQDLVDRLHAEGVAPVTIDCTLNPLRAIYRRALSRGEVGLNPVQGLELPRGGERRDRIASPTEAAELLAAVPAADRPVWATAMYAGLRRGELMALGAEHVDLASGVIRVERSWDAKEGLIGLKSKAGKRKVPIAAVLRDYLDALLPFPEGLAFGQGDTPFNGRALTDRADEAWKAAGLRRITPHECRHTFASLMIAAGVNAKALSTYMGHANISITLDRYGHLMPGNEKEAAGLLDAYLAGERERAEENARSAEPELAGDSAAPS
ncbi:MAG: tyrosine-type recombinase/integrase [Actinomycetota bacterium]